MEDGGDNFFWINGVIFWNCIDGIVGFNSLFFDDFFFCKVGGEVLWLMVVVFCWIDVWSLIEFG